MEQEIERDGRFGEVLTYIKRKIHYRFVSLSPDGIDVSSLRHDYLLKDIPDIDPSAPELQPDRNEFEEMPEVIPRDFTRKPPNEAQRARMRSDRSRNKQALRSACRCATSKAASAFTKALGPLEASSSSWPSLWCSL